MKVDEDKLLAEIDLNENAVYRVKNKVIDKVDTPVNGFGEQIINWQEGKPEYYKVSYTKK